MYPSPEARSDLEITGLKLSEEFAFTETQVSSRVPSNTSCPRHQTNPKDTRDHTRSRDPSPHSLPWATQPGLQLWKRTLALVRTRSDLGISIP